jgi:uncharacterized membrane protein YobD (UPF0266 family)
MVLVLEDTCICACIAYKQLLYGRLKGSSYTTPSLKQKVNEKAASVFVMVIAMTVLYANYVFKYGFALS